MPARRSEARVYRESAGRAGLEPAKGKLAKGGFVAKRPESPDNVPPSVTSDAVSLNGAQQVKRVACGFRNTENSRRQIRFHCTRAQRASTRFTTAQLPG